MKTMKVGQKVCLKSAPGIFGEVCERLVGARGMWQVFWLNHPMRSRSFHSAGQLKRISDDDEQYNKALAEFRLKPIRWF